MLSPNAMVNALKWIRSLRASEFHLPQKRNVYCTTGSIANWFTDSIFCVRLL